MLQIFLYLNLFIAGVAAALAARYGYEHYWNKKNPGGEVHTADLADASRAHLMQEAETRFKAILSQAAGDLQDDLHTTSSGISGRMKSLGDEIVELEMKRYADTLDQLRKTTEESIGLAAAAATKHQGELEAVLQERQKELEEALHKDMAAEKQRLVAELDKKLAGAVTAFLVETLGHNVDLGAQSTYLTEQLAAHKDELIKELTDES
jgi:hypothetical protein